MVVNGYCKHVGSCQNRGIYVSLSNEISVRSEKPPKISLGIQSTHKQCEVRR